MACAVVALAAIKLGRQPRSVSIRQNERQTSQVTAATTVNIVHGPGASTESGTNDVGEQKLRPIEQIFGLSAPAMISNYTIRGSDDLMEAYNRTARLEDRSMLTWMLGCIREEQAVPMFTATLFGKYGSNDLTEDQISVLMSTVRALGLVAQVSSSAFSFLQDGIEYEFWQTNRTWRYKGDRSRDTERMLVGYSIQALAASGRPEVPALLNDLRNRPTNYTYMLCGDIVSAACFYEMVSKIGPEEFNKHYVIDVGFDLYLKWKSTPAGKDWVNWRRQVKGENDAPIE